MSFERLVPEYVALAIGLCKICCTDGGEKNHVHGA